MDVAIGFTVVFACLMLILIYSFLNRDNKISGLHNKCVMITGCDSGFGHELALLLDSQGLRVFAGCLTEKGENVLHKKCSSRLKTMRMDVTRAEDVKRCFEHVQEFIESTNGVVLWAIVNNAGIAAPGPIEWTPVQDLKQVFDANVWGMLEVTKTFLPLLKKSCGRILNVASAAGKVPMPGAGAYSSSKFAVQCFTDVLRNELKPFGVSVHNIDPGFFKTNITDFRIHKQVMEKLWNHLSQETREEYGQEFCEKGMEMMQKMTRLASRDISQVAHAMKHAITSTHPKTRYILGWDHKLLWRWLALLPTGLQDFVLSSSYPQPKAAKL